jgi:hypothetical protein
MKRTATIAALTAAGIVWAGAAAGADMTALAKRREALASEYSLAKESSFYFVLDVLNRRLELRVRGMALRSWPLQAMRFWGRPEVAGMGELVKKTTLKAPERIVIKPGETEEPEPPPEAKPAAAASPAEFELEALELKDMPKRFSLDFDNGLHVRVKSAGAGSRGLIVALGDAWRWYVELPLRNLFGSRDGKALSVLELTFDNDKDAQAIYWHFFEGIKGLIL